MSIPFKDILVYLDGTEESMNAAMSSIILAKQNNSRLHALYVVNTKALSDLVKARIFIDAERVDYLKDLADDARRHLRHMDKLAQSKGLEVVLSSIEGSPNTEVVNYIKKNNIDLLVLGPVNVIRSRRDELLSENDRMLRTSPCPVLLVRDDDEIWQEFEEM